MKVIEKPAQADWSSYFNPWQLIQIPAYIWGAVSSIFTDSLTETPTLIYRQVVVLERDEKKTEAKENWEAADSYFQNETKAYKTQKFKLEEQTELNVARYFLTDMKRIGSPDVFFINGDKVIGPIETQEQQIALLKHMVKVAEGDLEKVSIWTQIWNHRPKMVLCDRIKLALIPHKGLNPKALTPIIQAKGFKEVSSCLNTKKGELTCHVRGAIEWGSNEEADLFTLNVEFDAKMIFDEIGETVEFLISYS